MVCCQPHLGTMLTLEVSLPPQCPLWPLQDCTICMERLVTASGYEGVLQHKGVRPELVGRLGRCGHMYHLLCLVAMYSNGNKVGQAGQWVGSDQGARWGLDTWGLTSSFPLPRMAACSVPPARPSTGKRRGLSHPGRWNSTSFPTRCRVSLTPKPSVLSTTSPRASRCAPLTPTQLLWPLHAPSPMCGLAPAAPPQGPEHPNPGKKFTARGFPRHCYLPNNEKGRKVGAHQGSGQWTRAGPQPLSA